MRGIGDPESTPTAFFVTAGVLVFIVVVLLVQGFYESSVQSLEQERLVDQTYRHVERYEAEQQERLSSYGFADEEQTSRRIPIERAMELVAAEGGGS